MKESRKRKSTVPMGVFGPAIDPDLDGPTEGEEAVDRAVAGMASDVMEKRTVLDVSLDQSKSEHGKVHSVVVQESNRAFAEQNASAADIDSDKSVEEMRSDEAADDSNGLKATTVLRDSRASVEDGDPFEVIAEAIDRFSIRVSEPPSEGESPRPELDSGDSVREKRHLTDATTDLGNAMKALFDNRKEPEWQDFTSAVEEAHTAERREASESNGSEETIEDEVTEYPVVPDSLQIPIDESPNEERLIVVEPADIEPIGSIAPLETKNAPPPGLPLIRGGVVGAATAIVLLAATTWAVIESRGNSPATQQRERSVSTAKPMVQAEVLSSVARRFPGSDTPEDPQSMRLADKKVLEQQTVRPKKSKAKQLSRRSKRAVRSTRRGEASMQTDHTRSTDPASAESKPVATLRNSISQETLPQTPSRDSIFATLTSLRSQVRRCVKDETGVADLDINIKGSGRVSHVVVHGDFRGTKQGSCIARLVRKARFKPFKQPEFRVSFPYAF